MKKIIARRRAFRSLLGLPFASSVLATTAIAWAASGKALAATSIEFNSESFEQLKRVNIGRPWVVHLWGMSSAQAVAQLPGWAQFVRSNSKASVVFVHFERIPSERIAHTLKQAGLAQLPLWLAHDHLDEPLRRQIDKGWSGELPRTVLIDSAGRHVAASSAIDFAYLSNWMARHESQSAPML